MANITNTIELTPSPELKQLFVEAADGMQALQMQLTQQAGEIENLHRTLQRLRQEVARLETQGRQL